LKGDCAIVCNRQGIIWTITGEGKGKTTAAFGQVLRALGQGQKVAIIQFLKGSQLYGESKFLKNICDERLLLKQFGLPTFVHSRAASWIDRDLAARGWLYGLKLLNADYDLIVFDEINVALNFGLLDEKDVIEALLSKPRQLSVILTGRNAPTGIITISNTVSKIENIKHHFDLGILAQSGIEF